LRGSIRIGARGYRADIDGLRAVAILSVVIYRPVKDVAPDGFVGGDVFFVISGFLISAIVLKGTNSGTFSLSPFIAAGCDASYRL
jgi:peptidoglycan/LPS O-acetylase OafA/YrhL